MSDRYDCTAVRECLSSGLAQFLTIPFLWLSAPQIGRHWIDDDLANVADTFDRFDQMRQRSPILSSTPLRRRSLRMAVIKRTRASIGAVPLTASRPLWCRLSSSAREYEDVAVRGHELPVEAATAAAACDSARGAGDLRSLPSPRSHLAKCSLPDGEYGWPKPCRLFGSTSRLCGSHSRTVGRTASARSFGDVSARQRFGIPARAGSIAQLAVPPFAMKSLKRRPSVEALENARSD